MSIAVTCPNCNELLAFEKQQAGRPGRCTRCRATLIVPKDDFGPTKLISELEHQDPLPGYYRAALIDSWKVFAHYENLVGMVFVAAAVSFKFFTGHTDYSATIGTVRIQAPLGLLISLMAWGALLWYYYRIIESAADRGEYLPDPDMGSIFGFAWNAAASIYLFIFALVVVHLPAGLVALILSLTGLHWQAPVAVLGLMGMALFPMAILLIGTGDYDLMFRFDYLIGPILKAPGPYAVAAVLTGAFWILQWQTVGYNAVEGSSKPVIAAALGANLAVQALAIIAMRATGLFYRHYNCCFKW